jgi:ATP-dependent protease HslVU (ClpYQ) peptidase subunit
LKNSLTEKILIIENLKVKDIITSTNVDYDFCVLSDIQTEKGLIEVYIYTKNVRRISQLKKGETVIDVKGAFSRFFSMLDNYYTKIEITNSVIEIK